MLVLMMLALAAPNPHTLDAPRRAFSTCLRAFENKSIAAKIEPAAYAEAIKSTCASEAAALASALTNYDVAMGAKRATAAATAASDVEDYRTTSAERFREIVTASRGN